VRNKNIGFVPALPSDERTKMICHLNFCLVDLRCLEKDSVSDVGRTLKQEIV
jgi:hypothetical protein